MDSADYSKSIQSWLLKILFLVVILGVLAFMAVPNHVGGGPSKTSGIINMLRQIDGMKMEWAIEHGYTNNIAPAREITAQDIAPYFYHERGQDPLGQDYLTRAGLVIDNDGNFRTVEGVVYVINALGIPPEAKFTKAFKLNDHGGFFSPKIRKGTIMRFGDYDVVVIVPGQESKPYKSLNEFLHSLN